MSRMLWARLRPRPSWHPCPTVCSAVRGAWRGMSSCRARSALQTHRPRDGEEVQRCGLVRKHIFLGDSSRVPPEDPGQAVFNPYRAINSQERCFFFPQLKMDKPPSLELTGRLRGSSLGPPPWPSSSLPEGDNGSGCSPILPVYWSRVETASWAWAATTPPKRGGGGPPVPHFLHHPPSPV